MLTRTAEHALRAVIYLARQPENRAVSAEQIAAALNAPANYMGKTLSILANAGIVRGRRGPRGGYRLLIAPAVLTIARVTDLFETEHGIAACLLGGKPCNPENPCDAHHRWLGVRNAAKRPLSTTTIRDLIGTAEAGEKTPMRVESAPFDSHEDGLIRLLYLA